MQLVSSGKFAHDALATKNHYYIAKGKSITPTPKKISASLI